VKIWADLLNFHSFLYNRRFYILLIKKDGGYTLSHPRFEAVSSYFLPHRRPMLEESGFCSLFSFLQLSDFFRVKKGRQRKQK
jgi:hypothetical protein